MLTKIAIAALVASAGMASAATLTTGSTTCSVTDVTIGLASSLACEGAYDGNDSNTDLDGIFGINDWVELAKVDMDDGEGGTSGVLTVGDGETSGSWSVSGFGDAKNIMLVLKGGPTFSSYLLSTTGLVGPIMGTWSTAGILAGSGASGPGLSHLTIYTNDVIDPTTPVPLPAAAWMLLAALGGLGLFGRRRTTA
jgi:hypothetical protein